MTPQTAQQINSQQVGQVETRFATEADKTAAILHYEKMLLALTAERDELVREQERNAKNEADCQNFLQSQTRIIGQSSLEIVKRLVQERDELKVQLAACQAYRPAELKTMTDLANKLSAAQGQVAHLQDALECIERAVDFVPKDEPLALWVKRAVEERDAALKANAEVNEKLDHLTTSLEPGTLPYWQKKHDDLLGKWFEAEAKCADIKAVLERCSVFINPAGFAAYNNDPGRQELIRDMLRIKNDDIGSDYVPKAELEKLKQANKALVEALRFIHDECDWKEYDSDGDNRIGESCSQALAHAKQLGL